MNDISYISLLSDAAILKKVGEFVKAKRIDQNLTQDEVAELAAISRSTLSLLERGDNIVLGNLLKVLRVLDALYVFEQFKVTEQISPIQLAKEDEKKRKRASRNHNKNDKDNLGW
jgi:transcriptional regulator with XRE-family HTH domain